MAYKPTAADAFVALTQDDLERFLSNQCASRGVTTDAQWSAAINAMTDAQFILLMRAFMKTFIGVGRTP